MYFIALTRVKEKDQVSHPIHLNIDKIAYIYPAGSTGACVVLTGEVVIEVSETPAQVMEKVAIARRRTERVFGTT